jgi:hypothetical protein
LIEVRVITCRKPGGAVVGPQPKLTTLVDDCSRECLAEIRQQDTVTRGNLRSWLRWRLYRGEATSKFSVHQKKP